MTEPYIGQIQVFGFNFSPKGWAFCNGTVMPIAQNTALFSLLGISYGGNGTTTFQLPNFTGRAGCQQGTGPGLTRRDLGQAFGTSNVTLLTTEMPAHSHGVNAYVPSTSGWPSPGGALSQPGVATNRPFSSGSPDTSFAPTMIGQTGGNQPHQNQQPYLAMNFCIALQGIYPSFQ
jgi:microcystin-dependent protein